MARSVHKKKATGLFKRRKPMYLTKLLKLGRRKGRDGNVIENEHRIISLEVEDMETRNLTDSTHSMKTVEQDSTTKILTVQDGDHSTMLVDYAVKMAQKLDCEIIALDVTEEPLNFTGERREREIGRFQQRARKNAQTLCLKAEAMGVRCRHLVEIGNQEQIIKALSRDDAGIRYVLLKPAQEYVTADRRQARVPVVDLNCSSL
jgi:hypothetical protein